MLGEYGPLSTVIDSAQISTCLINHFRSATILSVRVCVLDACIKLLLRTPQWLPSSTVGALQDAAQGLQDVQIRQVRKLVDGHVSSLNML